MGFGILFLGYFAGFIIFLGRLSICRVLGGAIIAIAALKLRQYNRAFDMLLGASIINILFYAVVAFFDIMGYINGTYTVVGTLGAVFSIIDIPITFLFHLGLLLSIIAIAKETDTPKIVLTSTRNLIFYCILLVFQLITLLPFSLTRKLSFIATLLSFVLSIFVIILIFRCYAQICDSNDIDMERKPSRFSFVNKIREESNERRKKADEAYAEKQRMKKGRR